MFAHLCLRTSTNELLACKQKVLLLMWKKLFRLLLREAPGPTFRSSFITLFPTLPTDDPGVTGLWNWAQENILTRWHTSPSYLSFWEPKSSAGWSRTSSFQENQLGSFEPSILTWNKYHLNTHHIPALKFSYNAYFSSTSSKLYSYCYKYSMFFGSLLGKMSGSFVMS